MERRRHDRYELWIPIEIERADGATISGIVHDVSERGVLAVTAESLEVGARLTVRFKMPPDGATEQSLTGEVIRAGSNSEDPDGPWPKEIALHFDSPIPDIDELARMGERKEG